MTFIICLVGR